MRLPTRLARAAVSSGVVALAVATWSPSARAFDQESTEAVEAARFEFVEGSSHFQAKRWAEALRAFEHSFSLAASPNTELMVARCLRELGRRVDAVAAYSSAAAEANRRVGRGEAKYAATADAAQSEGAAVRAQLGTIRVHVVRPSRAVTVTVDKAAITLSKDGEALVLHEPGTASVAVGANGAEQRQTVTVAPGATVEMDFDAPVVAPAPPSAPLRPPSPPETAPRSSRSWAGPLAIGGGVLTAAGLAVFAGFRLSSQSTFDELSRRCGPSNCGPSERAEADDGKRAETIGNIGLAVAGAAAIATVVFVVMALTSRDHGSARLFDGPGPGRL